MFEHNSSMLVLGAGAAVMLLIVIAWLFGPDFWNWVQRFIQLYNQIYST